MLNSLPNIVSMTNRSVKRDQLEALVPKEWGHEEWIVNNALYCGKKLVFKSLHRCSLHHHKIKHETFYVISGKVLLETELNGVTLSRVMMPGDSAQIPPLMWHRLTGIVESDVIEFSTHHMEEDSYRAVPSGKVELKDLPL